MAARFRITSEVIDPASMKRGLETADAGACATFEGWVRNLNEGETVDALEYETHAALAASEGEAVINEAIQQFPIIEARGIHRVGKLEIGECAVWVGVSSAHRAAAFDACRYIIDEIKHRLPIWKKEHYREGSSAWINCATRSPGEQPPAD